jgi:hypothetical protein
MVSLIALLLLDVTYKDHNCAMPFSIFATIIRLHIMNYVVLSAIIGAYKQKRKRVSKTGDPKSLPRKMTPPALQMEMKM